MGTKGLLRSRDFSSLSIKDLLEAREAYHVHLAHLDSVVATAIGRYRIRREDPDAEDPNTPPVKRPGRKAVERSSRPAGSARWIPRS